MTMARKKENIISVEGLSFSYGNRLLSKWSDTKKILDNISFNLPKGSFMCVTGESGSGKSTLLYILATLLKPRRGTYLFNNINLTRKNQFYLSKFRHHNIGILFQDFRLLPFLTVEKNIHLPTLFSGQQRSASHTKQLLEDFNIWDRRNACPSDISGGEAQRTALARVLILNPKLILLDEPTGNLDKKTEKHIIKYLMRIKKQGVTLFCVSHSEVLIQKADIVYKLHEGKLQLIYAK